MIKNKSDRHKLLETLNYSKLKDYFKIMSQLANKDENKYMDIYLDDMKYYYNQLGGDSLLGQFRHKPSKNKSILIAPDTIFGYFQRTVDKKYVKGDAAKIKAMLEGTKPGIIKMSINIKKKK